MTRVELEELKKDLHDNEKGLQGELLVDKTTGKVEYKEAQTAPSVAPSNTPPATPPGPLEKSLRELNIPEDLLPP
jgi:hypothetical protein